MPNVVVGEGTEHAPAAPGPERQLKIDKRRLPRVCDQDVWLFRKIIVHDAGPVQCTQLVKREPKELGILWPRFLQRCAADITSLKTIAVVSDQARYPSDAVQGRQY